MKTTFLRLSILALGILPTTVQAALIDPSRDRPADIPAGVDIRETIVRILNYALSFVGLIAVAMLIYAGFMYLFGGAGADVEKAKTIILNVVIGILIILASWVIVNTIVAQFTGVINTGNPSTGG